MKDLITSNDAYQSASDYNLIIIEVRKELNQLKEFIPREIKRISEFGGLTLYLCFNNDLVKYANDRLNQEIIKPLLAKEYAVEIVEVVEDSRCVSNTAIVINWNKRLSNKELLTK